MGGEAFPDLWKEVHRSRGGYEVAKLPEISYGAALDPKTARIVRYALEKADKVVTVDEALKRDAVKNIGVDGKNIETIPTAYETDKFAPGIEKDPRLVLTVGNLSKEVVIRKGLDVFVKAAAYLPDARFVVVGKQFDDSIDHLRKIAASNVEFAGFVSKERLVEYYQKAKVYCQLSKYEGLPNALVEAMLCECVPVGSEVSGIPTAIGDTGFYVPVGDAKATAEAIRRALASKKGKDARARVVSLFSAEKREQELVRVINELAA